MTEVHIDHTVKSKLLNIRLDKYLRAIGVRLSRSRISKIIREGNVTVNGIVRKPSYLIKTGDRIIVDYKKLDRKDIKPQDIPIDVIYEDEDIIVVNKDRDMVVHPARGNRDGTMVNALLHHSVIKGGEKFRPGVVHRLDKDTTGVMVFAKNEQSHASLGYQIEKRKVDKIYIAVVWGNLMRNIGTIEKPLGKKPSNRKLMAVTPVNSKHAVTHYRVIERMLLATMLRIRLETGRTHQIRVHLSHSGHPVIGDDYYSRNARGTVKTLPVDIKKHYEYIDNLMERQALHAASLSFRHPVTKEKMSFYAPLPRDMIELIEELRIIKDNYETDNS